MSNSKLATYTHISPNQSGKRNHVIDTVSIHCVVAQWSAKKIVDFLSDPSRQASCNYAVGFDGSIAIGVEEDHRSWCTSSRSNDNRAVTIEVASDTYHPYAVTDAAMKSLIKLLVDICQRNNIPELRWKADKSLIGHPEQQNMTVHRWFANKACPGDYLYERHGWIAEQVNAVLKGNSEPETPSSDLYRVQLGAFSKAENAQRCKEKAEKAGFSTYVTMVNDLYRVQIGAFKSLSNAETLQRRAREAGFDDCFITTESGKPVDLKPEKPVIKVGSIVKIRYKAKSYEGTSMASFVYKKQYRVDYLTGKRAVLDKNGLCTAFNVDDLILIK